MLTQNNISTFGGIIPITTIDDILYPSKMCFSKVNHLHVSENDPRPTIKSSDIDSWAGGILVFVSWLFAHTFLTSAMQAAVLAWLVVMCEHCTCSQCVCAVICPTRLDHMQ